MGIKNQVICFFGSVSPFIFLLVIFSRLLRIYTQITQRIWWIKVKKWYMCLNSDYIYDIINYNLRAESEDMKWNLRKKLLEVCKKFGLDMDPMHYGIDLDGFKDLWRRAPQTRPNRVTVLNQIEMSDELLTQIYDSMQKASEL